MSLLSRQLETMLNGIIIQDRRAKRTSIIIEKAKEKWKKEQDREIKNKIREIIRKNLEMKLSAEKYIQTKRTRYIFYNNYPRFSGESRISLFSQSGCRIPI